MRARPVEDALICLDGLSVLGECPQSGTVDGDKYIVLQKSVCINCTATVWEHTFRPATISLPSGVHASVNGCSPTLTSPTLAFDRMSQNLTVPSVLQLASSFSLIGWKATRSSCVLPGTPGVRSSVEFLTFVFSGFHIRNVRSAAPVAMNVPEAFQLNVRM